MRPKRKVITGTRIAIAAGVLFAVELVLSTLHPWGNPHVEELGGGPILAGTDTSAEAVKVLTAKCADCHSTATHWPLYSRVAPVSWLVERDVMAGRDALDLSKWAEYSSESQVDLLSRIASEARSGEMPLKQYLIVHPDARLTPSEQELVYNWAKQERKRVRKAMASQPDQPVAK